MAAPTREDAQLMVQLAQWGSSLGIDEAMHQLFSDDFDPDSANLMSEPAVRKVLLFGESIGTLTKHGLLSSELVTDWLWVEGMWARVRPAALGAREHTGQQRLYENFEALATGA